MKDSLILSDETVIELEAFSSLGNLFVLSDDKQSMVATWDKLISSNLENVKIMSPDKATIGRYKDVTLISETSYMQADGSILTSYKLTGEQVKEEAAEETEV
ncbi:MAG: hypothetical protein ACRDBM_18240 [Sporomusa sp.]